MSVAALMEPLDATIVVGDREVLYGFPEFEARRIQSDLSQYMIGAYPTLNAARVGPRRALRGSGAETYDAVRVHRPSPHRARRGRQLDSDSIR